MKRLLSTIAALVLASLLAAPTASAANYHYYVPLPAQIGGAQREIYTPYVMQAHEGLSGAALVDAVLKELRKLLPEQMKAIQVSYPGGPRATISIDGQHIKDPNVADRVLGAVYHTLKACGVATVELHGRPITGQFFSRGAAVPVVPLSAALPPNRISYGYVRYGSSVVTAADFYRLLGEGDRAITSVALKQLEMDSTEVKLAILRGLPSIRMRDRSVVLMPRLEDPSVKVRLKALEMLNGYSTKDVKRALAQVVEKDPSPEAKIAAVKLLVSMGNRKYKRYLLLDKLKDPNPATVIEAAKGLMAANDTKFATAFAPLVTNTDPSIRKAGVEGMVHYMQWPEMAAFLDDKGLNRDTAELIARELSSRDTGAARARAIGWMLTQGSEADALAGAKLAGEKRVGGTTKHLGEALKRDEQDIRLAAAKSLGQLRDPAGLGPLAKAIRDAGDEKEAQFFSEQAIAVIAAQPFKQVINISKSPDATIRELAIKSLSAKAENPRVVQILQGTLKDPEKGIRRAAAFALARIRSEKVVTHLLAVKDDPDAVVRSQVVVALKESTNPKANATLMRYLDDRDNSVKQEAVAAVRARALTAAMPKLMNMVEYRHDGVRHEVVQAIIALTKPGEAKLFDLWARKLYDSMPEIRILAIDKLAEYTHDRRSASTIGGAVMDRVVKVKIHALNALAESKDASAWEQAVRGLFDTDKTVKMAALDALFKLKPEKARKALQEFILNESDPDVKKRATEVLDEL